MVGAATLFIVIVILKDPLLDENVLNELCLSDELWANLNIPMPASIGQMVTSESDLDSGKYLLVACMMYFVCVTQVFILHFTCHY